LRLNFRELEHSKIAVNISLSTQIDRPACPILQILLLLVLGQRENTDHHPGSYSNGVRELHQAGDETA